MLRLRGGGCRPSKLAPEAGAELPKRGQPVQAEEQFEEQAVESMMGSESMQVKSVVNRPPAHDRYAATAHNQECPQANRFARPPFRPPPLQPLKPSTSPPHRWRFGKYA